MPYQSLARSVLAQWRAVERALAKEPPDSPAVEHLQSEAKRLRDEYQALITAARAAHRPEPPPLPGSEADA